MTTTSYIYDLGRAFLATANEHADAPALRYGSDTISYRELAALAQEIAHRLKARGIGPGNVLAIQSEKSPAAYAALLGCLISGACYTHLDPQNPTVRLARIFATCRPALVVTDGPASPTVSAAADGDSIPVLTIEQLLADTAEHIGSGLGPIGSDPAYIMFTSGSTGQPKGVAIAHSSVLNFISWTRSMFGIGRGDVVANLNPVYFDNSVFDIYSALFTGACLAPITPAELVDPTCLLQRVDEAECTLWFSVPSLLIYLMTLRALTPESVRSLRTIVFGGEGYPKRELAKLYAIFGSRCRLVNVYGPTEGTCICSAHNITHEDIVAGGTLPPLGRIAKNFSYRIMNGEIEASCGEPGELCLTGPQLALGYYNDSSRTASAFVQDPLATALSKRIYRTGDLVREVGGLLHFIGRKDNQIKHMGYRIELEEIEAAVAGLEGVWQTAVVYQRHSSQIGRIVAFVAGAEASQEPELRSHLAEILPSYMVPNRIIFMDALPMNANGKVDRARLAELR